MLSGDQNTACLGAFIGITQPVKTVFRNPVPPVATSVCLVLSSALGPLYSDLMLTFIVVLAAYCPNL